MTSVSQTFLSDLALMQVVALTVGAAHRCSLSVTGAEDEFVLHGDRITIAIEAARAQVSA